MRVSLRVKIILLLIFALSITIGLVLIATNSIVKQSHQNQLLENLDRAAHVAKTLLETRSLNLMRQGKLVAIVPGLTDVTESGNPSTVKDFCLVYRNELRIPIFDVFDSNGHWMSSVDDDIAPELTPHLSNIIINTYDTGNSSSEIDRRNKQLVLVATFPIGLVNDPSGVLMMGYDVDDAFADQIKQFTNIDISFLVGNEIQASSLREEGRRNLLAQLQKVISKDKDVLLKGKPAELPNSILEFIPLKNSAGETLAHLIVQYPLTDFLLLISTLRWSLLLVGGIVLVLIAGIGAIFTGPITRSLGQVRSMLRDIAEGEGDLTKRVEATSNDEIGDLAGWFNVFMNKLHETIRRIILASQKLAEIASGISASTQEIAAGAQQQLENFEKLTIGIQANADTASSANKVAQITSSDAERIGGGMENMIAAMNNIEKSFNKITNTVALIADIADETNLLALNAAIEAARAGEHGRGFSVVADEIRKLAENSAALAKEIETLVKESTSTMEEGAQLSRRAGEDIKKIVLNIINVADQIDDISKSTHDQTTKMRDNASIAESYTMAAKEMATLAEQMANQANVLNDLVRQFKIQQPQQEPAAKIATNTSARKAKKRV